MLYEEAKRQTYMGLPYEDYQWLEQMYLDYGYLNQSEFWEAFHSLLKEMGVNSVYFFTLCRSFQPIHSTVDMYFFFYPVLRKVRSDLRAMKEQVRKYDLDDGMLAP